MAATTQLARPVRVATPAVLWHLLSLDAPTVAALWAWFIARASHVHLPAAASAAMALAVWIVYAADRLLDTRLLDAHPLDAHLLDTRPPGLGALDLEERHYFHHRHRRAFVAGMAVATAALVALLPLLDPGALRLYLVEGLLLAAWFVILHATPSAYRLPKEIAVGLFFSAAVFIPTVARQPALRLSLAPQATLFAALCSLNCLFIYAWEHARTAAARSPAKPPHLTTRIALAHLCILAAAIVVAGLALMLFTPATFRPIAACCSLSAVLLLLLHRNRALLSRTHLRAAADLALLTPLLLVPMLEFFPR